MLYGNFANSILHNSGGDLSRPAKFVAMIDVPEVMKSTVPTDTIDILCKTFSIPTIKMETIEVKYKGHTIPVRGRVNFEQTVSVTFLLDENHDMRQLFKNWIEGLDTRYIGKVSEISNSLLNAKKSETFGGMNIGALNWDEDTIMEYKFYNVYPISVSGPEFSSDTVSSVNEFTVEFAYTTFESNGTGVYNWNNKLGDTIEKASSYILGSGDSGRKDTIPGNNELKDFFSGWGQRWGL